MNWSKYTILWAVIIILVVITGVFMYRGLLFYKENDLNDFIIGLRAQGLGVTMGAAFSLLTVIISLQLESGKRQNALNTARFLFLSEDVEGFKDALIAYLNKFRLAGEARIPVSQSSWESFDKKLWPQKRVLRQLTRSISSHNISGMYTVKDVKASVNDLADALQKIISASATNIFEGKEHLVKRAVFTALFELKFLKGALPEIILDCNEDDEIDLSKMAPRLKQCAIICSKVLEDMAGLASVVKTG